jgi:hypothetical protein
MPRGVRRGRVGRPPKSLAGGGLQGALSGLVAYRTRLAQQRIALDAEIAALDAAVSAIGGQPAVRAGRPAGRRPGRPAGRSQPTGPGPRKGSLKEFILRVLTGGGEMAVKDIAAGVLRRGYETSNKTLAKSVGIALTELPGVVKLGRGRFQTKH